MYQIIPQVGENNDHDLMVLFKCGYSVVAVCVHVYTLFKNSELKPAFSFISVLVCVHMCATACAF